MSKEVTLLSPNAEGNSERPSYVTLPLSDAWVPPSPEMFSPENKPPDFPRWVSQLSNCMRWRSVWLLLIQLLDWSSSLLNKHMALVVSKMQPRASLNHGWGEGQVTMGESMSKSKQNHDAKIQRCAKVLSQGRWSWLRSKDKVAEWTASLLDGERECNKTQDAEWIKYLFSAARRAIISTL